MNFVKNYFCKLYQRFVSEEYLKEQLFKGKFLIVNEGLEPHLLNWKNFGVRTSENCIRYIIYVIYTLLTLYICFNEVFKMETIVQDAETAVREVKCKQDVTA